MISFYFRNILRKPCNYDAIRRSNLLAKQIGNKTCRQFLSTLRRVKGIEDYEKERLLYKVFVPEKFNFASDVLDTWAQKEKEGARDVSVPAFWFVSDDGKELKLNFQQLQEESKRVASILQDVCGIKKGDYVIVMLPKIPEFWLINIAALRIGFIMSPATMMLRAKDLVYRLSALKPSYIIAHESVVDVVDEASNLCPTLKQKIVVSNSNYRKPGWCDFHSLQPKQRDHKCVETRSDDAMMLFFTSGTTGNPKMVEHTHASYGIGLQRNGKYFYDLNSNNIMWNMSDTGWAKTAYGSFFGPWSRGSGVFIHQMSKVLPTKVLQVLSNYPIDTLCAPPLVYRALVAEKLSSYKFKKLEHCLSAGEALNPEVIKKWMAATNLKIYEGYGQTENAGLVSMQKSFEYKMGSMGKPKPGVNVKIVDENENEVKPNEIGEIVCEKENTLGLFKGYKDNPEENRSKFSKKYFHTGDLGYMDEEGYYWFVGRNDDVINTAGYRIGPFEVESALMEHPAVAEVAVVSSPDEERGEVVKAFVILKGNIEPSSELIEELKEHCKKITAPYKYPRKIEFIKEFPKTTSGKIIRSELKRKEWKT